MGMIKTLWYIRKVRIYEALVRKMTQVRMAVKAKQAKYQAKAEKYRTKVSEETSISKG